MQKIALSFIVLLLFIISCSSGNIKKDISSEKSDKTLFIKKYEQKTFYGYSLKETLYDFPISDNPQVHHWIKYFTNKKGKGNSYFSKYMLRGERYVPYLQKYLKEQDMPEDLAYLALIESGFSNYAKSHAQAVGLWQFIQSTGERYGLSIGPFIDERRNPEQSTKAAINYLKDLYQEFGDWYLAIAAYNCGEERLRRGIIEGGTRDYWTLVDYKIIPKETSQYVPKMIAAIILAKNPSIFNLDHSFEEGKIIHSPIIFNSDKNKKIREEFYKTDPNYKFFNDTLAEVFLPHPVDLIQLSLALEMTLSDLKIYNPEIVGWFSPEDYSLKIPSHKLQNYQVELENRLGDFLPEYYKYKVSSNTNVKNLAKKLNLSEEVLLAFNQQLEPNQNLKKGDLILLPLPKDKSEVVVYGLEKNPRKRIKY